jgi:hypothetical protein
MSGPDERTMDVLRVIKEGDDTSILEQYHTYSESMKTNQIIHKSTVGKDAIFYMKVKHNPVLVVALSKV